MRQKIWYELMQIRFNLEYLALHGKLQRNLKIYIPIIFIIIALGAGLLGLLKSSWSLPAIVFCFLSAFFEIIKLIWKDCIASDHMLCVAEEIHRFYNALSIKMEELWLNYESQKINEDTASRLYFQYKKDEQRKRRKIDEVHFELFDRRIRKIADTNVRIYTQTHLS